MIIIPKEVQKEIDKVSEIAAYLWNREWAERNAGNISVNITKYFDDIHLGSDREFEYKFPVEAAGYVLFITGTGCHLRHLIDRVEEAACIIKINKSATGYSIIWGGEKENFAPTSELISHVKIHLYNSVHNPTHKTIVHTHPIELIVLSHHPLFGDQDLFNHSLWKMCPEIRVFVPKGVHCTSYALPSSEELADKTIVGLHNHNVILWEKHGALATGEDAEKAFDYLDVANKGAKMLLTAWASGFDPIGLSNEQLKGLEQFL
jgi:rhamnulose-1-phosphate aldolase